MIRVRHPTLPLEALTTNEGKDIIVVDRSASKEVHGFPRTAFGGHAGAVLAVAVTPNGKWVASASAGQNSAHQGSRKRRKIAMLEGHSSIIKCLAFSPDGRTRWTASYDNTVVVWDAANPSSSKRLS